MANALAANVLDPEALPMLAPEEPAGGSLEHLSRRLRIVDLRRLGPPSRE